MDKTCNFALENSKKNLWGVGVGCILVLRYTRDR